MKHKDWVELYEKNQGKIPTSKVLDPVNTVNQAIPAKQPAVKMQNLLDPSVMMSQFKQQQMEFMQMQQMQMQQMQQMAQTKAMMQPETQRDGVKDTLQILQMAKQFMNKSSVSEISPEVEIAGTVADVFENLASSWIDWKRAEKGLSPSAPRVDKSGISKASSIRTSKENALSNNGGVVDFYAEAQKEVTKDV